MYYHRGNQAGNPATKTMAQDAATQDVAENAATSGCEYDENCCGAIIRNSESLYGNSGAIPSDTLIYRATEIFSALADSTRF
jgi:hypothetical protein